MAEKIITACLIQKHDVEAQWNKSSYIPRQGELILYDPDADHAYGRIKIGDNTNYVKDLKFFTSTGEVATDTDIDTLFS